MNIEIGKAAPDFDFTTSNGEQKKLSDYKGNFVVLYFYPKDDTSGCTAEACSWRDNMERITPYGAIVIGVSPDDEKSHQKFKTKYNLNFELVSDTEKTISADYGVWVEKSLYGRKYMGVERSTFIIDNKGLIKKIYRNVKVEGHADDVIRELRNMD
jgi:thioredoxin-dependent peroxiredoxin